MSLQVGKVIYNILSNDEKVKEKVNNKIYPLVADNGTTFPFIVYKRLNIVPANSKDRFVYQETDFVEVAVASDNYNESIELADLVRTALEGKKGIFNNISISKIDFEDANENFLDDTYIQTITFKIFINNG